MGHLSAVLLALWLSGPASAALSREDVPPSLQPWISWALKGQEQALCPFFHGQDQRDCFWPGALKLTLEEKSGRFEQSWVVQAPGWVSLPGGPENWPQEVRADGAPAPVVQRGSSPAVRLKPGTHVLSGSFKWDGLPEQLQVAPETGLLALSVRGQAVPFPPRDEAGRLWLAPKSRPAPVKEEAHLDVSVHRKLTDDVPLRLLTRVQLKVSGANREVVLGRALPEGFVPMSLEGPLPVRLEADGRLRVQVRAGTWDLVLSSRRENQGDEIKLPAAGGPWDADEAWVFEAQPALRQAELQGLPSLDPEQTELPGDWRSLPAFLVRPGDTARLVQRRRGDDPPTPDRLTLSRDLWLDFDGRGFTARDSIGGSLAHTWRLETNPEMKLGRVSVNSRDQFLTALSSGGPAGLEVRSADFAISADSRIDSRRLPATGWRHDFESVSAQLRLPPGWRILHAGGVDSASPTWVATWTLLDFFLVFIAAAAFTRLWGPRWGAAALAGIGLAWHEPDAPRWLWIWTLLFTALDRALEESGGALSTWTKFGRKIALAGLVLVSVPFLISQVRWGLYPQLQYSYHSIQTLDAGSVDKAPRQEPPPQRSFAMKKSKHFGGSRGAMGMISGAASSVESESDNRFDSVVASPSSLYEGKSNAYAREEAVLNQLSLDPNAQVSTGPGMPYWSWTTVNLSWKGPVGQNEHINLWLLSPRSSFFLTLARVALVIALALLLAGLPVAEWLAKAAKSLPVLMLVLLLCPGAAQAQSAFPPKDLLDDLRGRFLERPDCAPICADSPSLVVQATPQWLSLRLEVHAAAATAVPIPTGGREWSPARATLDGAAAGVRRRENGSLWVSIPAGSRQLVLEGPLPDRDSVQISLPLRPRHVQASVSGWTLNGLRENGRAENTLQLSRSRGAAQAEVIARAQGIFPPFLKVHRTVSLGLSWRVTTEVERLTPAATPVTVQIPLIPGEAVMSSEVHVVEGQAQVSLPPGARSISWVSALKETNHLSLLAPRTSVWTELWDIEPSSLWHVEPKGIPAAPLEGAHAYRFIPWPGEALELSIARPAAVVGQSLTIDQSVLTVSPGLRASDVVLSLSVRSSRGGQHTVVLPEGELLSVKIDGRQQPLRLEGHKLTVPVQPGAHALEAAWRQPEGARLFYKAATTDLGAASVNAHTIISMPSGRWTLFLGGSGMGPAVMFWSLLTIFLLISFGLSKSGLAPLTWKEWFLLSLGLTQVSVISAAVVVAWFVAMGRRGSHPPQARLKLTQVFLALLTLAAAICLFGSIKQGLLGLPDMQIAGNGSSADQLRWYIDRCGAVLPRPWVFSVPLWVYRLAMLSWALWLADSLLRWARWAWGCWTTDGFWK